MSDRIKIMIVEDHPLNLKLICDLLEMDGHEVFANPDAESALEQLEHVAPDVILTDVGLPGMDGLQMTRLLRANDRTKDIKIIALTAFAMRIDKERVIEAGCDGYITKPIDTRLLTRQILEIIK